MKAFLTTCGCFLWHFQIYFRISKDAKAAGGVSCENIAHVLRSKPIKRLVEHRSRTLVDKLANGFPTKTVNEWSTWGIKAAVRYNSGNSVLKLLELINISCVTTTHTEQQYRKWGSTILEYNVFKKQLGEYSSHVLKLC